MSLRIYDKFIRISGIFLYCICFSCYDIEAKTALNRIGEEYDSFQDPVNEEFGLVNSKNVPCLLLKFSIKLYNFNLNNTDIATESVDFTSNAVRIGGYCALHNEIRKRAMFYATWRRELHRKTLRFYFNERLVASPRANQPDELRWELNDVKFTEQFKTHSVTFTSSRPDLAALISAPLNQKFLCKDSVNVTVRNVRYANIVVEFQPGIDIQPMNTGSGYGSNVYLCDRTRRRTLRESFQSRVTVLSGIVLGISSVSVLIWHSLRRHLKVFSSDFACGIVEYRVNGGRISISPRIGLDKGPKWKFLLNFSLYTLLIIPFSFFIINK